MEQSSSTSVLNTKNTQRSVTIHDLPIEMLWKVFSYLGFNDLRSACSVSRSWKVAGNGPPLMVKHEYTITSKDDPSQIAMTLQSIPMLRYIRITSKNMNSKNFLTEFCRDIRYLHIDDFKVVDSDILSAVVKNNPNLESLSVKLFSTTSQIIKPIKDCTKLHTFALSQVSLYGTVYIDLSPIAAGCPNLINIDIRNCSYSSDAFIYLLTRKKHLLQSLLFTCENIPRGTVPPFSECTCLEHIQCTNHSEETLQLGQFLDEISGLTGLKRLGLEIREDTTEDEVMNLSECSFSGALTDLNLTYNFVSTDISGVIASCLPKVTKLYVETSGYIYVDVFEGLLNVWELENLEIKNLRFTEGFLGTLLKRTQISYLVINECSDLTDNEASRLVGEMKLKCLKISGKGLTNGFLQTLPYCKTLQELYVTVEDPLEETVRALKLRQPSTRITVFSNRDLNAVM